MNQAAPQGAALAQPLNPRELRETLRTRLTEARKIAVIGIGSELRGDDVAGVMIAQAIRDMKLPDVQGFIGYAAPENITGEVTQYLPDHMIFVDAADLGLNPGHIGLIDPKTIEGVSFSTHTLPLKIIIHYLLEKLGPRCGVTVLGIQPKGTEICAPPSAEVQGAVRELIEAIAEHGASSSGR